MKYFIVFYTAHNENGNSVLGNADIWTERPYLSQALAILELKRKNNFSNLVIINIIQLTQNEYIEWIS